MSEATTALERAWKRHGYTKAAERSSLTREDLIVLLLEHGNHDRSCAVPFFESGGRVEPVCSCGWDEVKSNYNLLPSVDDMQGILG